MGRRSLVRGHEAQWFALFSRFAVHEATRRKYAERPDMMLVSLEDLYREV